MDTNFELQSGEKLLRKDKVSLVTGKLATRTGMCYLTNRRILVDSESKAVGFAGAFSFLGRKALQKTEKFGPQLQEFALRQVTHILLKSYGISSDVSVSLSDESQVRMVFSGKAGARWIEDLGEELKTQDMALVSDGENTWRVRLAG